MSYLDNIKLLASELASMSPRTQLEIVKLCKNLCIEVKDFLVDFTENDFAESLSRITAIEGRLDSDEDDIALHTQEIASINSSIDNIIIDLNNRYTKQEINTILESYYTKSQIDALLLNKADKATTYTKTETDALLDEKLNVQVLYLTGGSANPLTDEQFALIESKKNIIISYEGEYFYRKSLNTTGAYSFVKLLYDTETHEDASYTPHRNSQYLYCKEIRINRTTHEWTLYDDINPIVLADFYSKAETDTLIDRVAVSSVNLDRIVDDDENRRFIEGNGTNAVVTGLTINQNKWSLSGTHLMLVVAGVLGANYDESATKVISTFSNIPSWILNKINTVAGSLVEAKNTILWGSDFSQVEKATNMQKTQQNTLTINLAPTTANRDRTFRIQYDLLIDTD